jgi:hypothetical protein
MRRAEPFIVSAACVILEWEWGLECGRPFVRGQPTYHPTFPRCR